MFDKKPISIKDIAKLSGYSIATVSRVINHKGQYSKETEQKILNLIETYGYVSNNAAKSLRASKSNTIGLIIPDITNEFYATIALHVEHFFADASYSVFVCNAANDPQKELMYFRTLDSRLVDGIICISGLQYFPKNLTSRNIPIVCIDRYPDNQDNIPFVASDDMDGSYQATEYLIQKGCRKILNIESYTASYDKRLRTAGYEKALLKYGIPINKELYLRVTGRDPSHIEAEILLAEYLQRGSTCDGIFASSDRAALGSLYALQRYNLKIPEDVQIIGFDNTLYTILCSPTISTISRNTVAMAKKASQILLDMICDKEPEQRQTIVPIDLILRQSTH